MHYRPGEVKLPLVMSTKRQKTDETAGPPAHSGSHAPTIRNRKAFHEYHVVERVEAGLVLTGTEVKSLRAGNAQFEDAFARLREGEVWLIGANVAVYPQARGVLQHDPLRPRKCLLRSAQVRELEKLTAQKGFTLIPLAIYFGNGFAKVELGVAQGKRSFDKRDDIKKKQAKRDIDREMRRRR